jgi:Dienelactone hydrolase and related enzymes
MPKLSMLPTILTAAFCVRRRPGAGRDEEPVGRVQPRRHQAQGLYGLRRQGQRQAPRRAGGPCARGHDAEDAGAHELWAKLGYVSFAADIFGYGQGVLPKDVPEMQAQIAIYSDDRPLMRARTQAGYDALLKNPMVDPAKVALIGYCFGGGVGVEFGSTGAPLSPMFRSTARSATITPDGRRTPRACI